MEFRGLIGVLLTDVVAEPLPVVFLHRDVAFEADRGDLWHSVRMVLFNRFLCAACVLARGLNE